MGNISDIPVFDEVPWHLTSRDFVTPCCLPKVAFILVLWKIDLGM